MRVVIEKQGMEYSRQVKNLRIRGKAGLRSRYVCHRYASGTVHCLSRSISIPSGSVLTQMQYFFDLDASLECCENQAKKAIL